MSESKPTAREIYLSDDWLTKRSTIDQEECERRFFTRVRLRSKVFKTTYSRRLDDVNEALNALLPRGTELQLMDVAISSGISTQEWMGSLSNEGLDFHMVAGDLNIRAFLLSVSRNLEILVDRSGYPLHLDILGRGMEISLIKIIPRPASYLIKRSIARVLRRDAPLISYMKGDAVDNASRLGLRCTPIRLLSPRLREHPRLEIIEDDIASNRSPSLLTRFHAIRAANILNHGYFSKREIRDVLMNLRRRLRPNGLLVVCRTLKNSQTHGTIFALLETGLFQVMGRIGDGSEIEEDVVTLSAAETDDHIVIGTCGETRGSPTSAVNDSSADPEKITDGSHFYDQGVCDRPALPITEINCDSEHRQYFRLTLVIPSLSCGGAERVMANMANYWAAKAWSVTLLTFDDGSTAPFYQLDKRVSHVALGIAGESRYALQGLIRNARRVRSLRHAVRSTNPDVTLSFLDRTNVLTLLATRGLKTRVVVSERSDPRMNYPGLMWLLLRRFVYPSADALVVQSRGAFKYFLPRLQSRTSIIPNPVLAPAKNAGSAIGASCRPVIVAMGRMVEAKGFDLLLQAFAQLKNAHPGWRLAILGDGPLFGEMKRLRNSLGLQDRVLLPGRVRNTQAYLNDADIFVMSSRYEGFPNALCEAMATGVASISTDCPSGPREIIRHGVDGLLVASENVEALAAGMDQLMSDELERTRLAERAAEITTRFALTSVAGMWENVLAATLGAQGPLPAGHRLGDSRRQARMPALRGTK